MRGSSTSQFYHRKNRLARAGAPHTRQTPLVVRLRITPAAPAADAELVLPSGALLRVPADTRPERIVAVLRGLEVRPC